MGVTTTISLFHHDRYRSCVVPAVRRLLRTGELGPWLAAVWEHLQSRNFAVVGRPAGDVPTGAEQLELSPDLSEAQGQPETEWFDLPARHTRERDDLIELFQRLVEGCCLGESVGMGNYTWLQFPYGYHETPELEACLWYLGNGALVWNDGRGGYVEGICGWLTPGQTAVLARELHRMMLPDRPPESAQLSADPQGYYAQQTLHRLAHLRGIADRAWETGHGLLCGNDLGADRFAAPHPAYSTETVQLLARVIRDRREFDVLPVLADALQEAGCENDVVLTHCRDANEHTDACWVADLILANEPVS